MTPQDKRRAADLLMKDARYLDQLIDETQEVLSKFNIEREELVRLAKGLYTEAGGEPT